MENEARNHQDVSTPPKIVSFISKNSCTPIKKLSIEEEKLEPPILGQETEGDDGAQTMRLSFIEVTHSLSQTTRTNKDVTEKNGEAKTVSIGIGFSTYAINAGNQIPKTCISAKLVIAESGSQLIKERTSFWVKSKDPVSSLGCVPSISSRCEAVNKTSHVSGFQLVPGGTGIDNSKGVYGLGF